MSSYIKNLISYCLETQKSSLWGKEIKLKNQSTQFL